MSSPITTSASSALTTAVATSPSLFRRAVLDALRSLPHGRLQMQLPDKTVLEFGDASAVSSTPSPWPAAIATDACIHVRRESFFRKCALGGDIGFGESFVDGDWDTPDLTAVIAWFIRNIEHAPTLSGSRRRGPLLSRFLRSVDWLRQRLRANSRAQARRNISEHYDLSNDFFALFLDESMMYSSALWADPGFTLAEAQQAKNAALCRSLRLRPEDHVLEIGTGWGGWSLQAAREHGCRVTTVTLSRQQYDFARARVHAAGLGDRIEVRLQDYRDIGGRFDKIVSIEMLEAVGHRYQKTFFETCSRLLAPQGLIALQFITCPDARYDQFRRGVDFIQKHIFPGSLLLSLNRVNGLLAATGGFSLHHMIDFGQDYARTLRLWREAFLARLDAVRGLGFDDRFIRKWTYYLGYCEAAFALRNISVVQTLHTRANNLSF